MPRRRDRHFSPPQPTRLVLWHDYGVWNGATRALEELEDVENLGLRHIRGTSLVFWRAAV
jgi:hypothetical protein